LFRTGVLRRHHAGRRYRHPFLRRRNPRDAEVQQLRLAVGRQQNVPGLNIAVDDQALVRVVDGAADHDEKLEPPGDRRLCYSQ
jgi:hypothetical protein